MTREIAFYLEQDLPIDERVWVWVLVCSHRVIDAQVLGFIGKVKEPLSSCQGGVLVVLIATRVLVLANVTLVALHCLCQVPLVLSGSHTIIPLQCTVSSSSSSSSSKQQADGAAPQTQVCTHHTSVLHVCMGAA